MSQTKFIIRKAYVLSAINKSGERVYYDTDPSSGGYPYWSTYRSPAREFSSLNDVPVLRPGGYMRNAVTKIEVLEVECQATVVSSTEIVSLARAAAEAEIAKIQAQLESKIAALKEMK